MTYQDSVSVAANAKNDNVLDGKMIQRIPMDAVGAIRVYHTGSAAGLEADFNVNTSTELERGDVSALNRIPLEEDLVVKNAPGPAGGLLKLAAYNTTGGALTYNYRVEIDLMAAYAPQ